MKRILLITAIIALVNSSAVVFGTDKKDSHSQMVGALHLLDWLYQSKMFTNTETRQFAFQKSINSSITLWTLFFFDRQNSEANLKLKPSFFDNNGIEYIDYSKEKKLITVFKFKRNAAKEIVSAEVESYSVDGQLDFMLSSSSTEIHKITSDTLHKEISKIISVIATYASDHRKGSER